MGEVKVIKCEKCKTQVELHNGWANMCQKCGAEYNGFGQILVSREQWGMEYDSYSEEGDY